MGGITEIDHSAQMTIDTPFVKGSVEFIISVSLHLLHQFRFIKLHRIESIEIVFIDQSLFISIINEVRGPWVEFKLERTQNRKHFELQLVDGP